MGNILYVVVPCYNEEAVLHETGRRLLIKFEELVASLTIAADSRIVFVNDGSIDRTWEIIAELHQSSKFVDGINLSRNMGHQNAVIAGLLTLYNRCDYVISLDADLQDDINSIDKMVSKYHEGYDIVYGVRSARKNDTLFKKWSAELFYRFMKKMDVELVFNHADYRLMSRRVIENLNNFKEVNLFLRGLIPLIGFKSCSVFYERSERFAGESKYPLKKMVLFALNGITSFSVKPLKYITLFGFIIFIISLFVMGYIIIGNFLHHTTAGWSSVVCSIWLIGGIQIIFIGIIGEYIGKIFNEVKQRPRFIISEELTHGHV